MAGSAGGSAPGSPTFSDTSFVFDPSLMPAGVRWSEPLSRQTDQQHENELARSDEHIKPQRPSDPPRTPAHEPSTLSARLQALEDARATGQHALDFGRGVITDKHPTLKSDGQRELLARLEQDCNVLQNRLAPGSPATSDELQSATARAEQSTDWYLRSFEDARAMSSSGKTLTDLRVEYGPAVDFGRRHLDGTSAPSNDAQRQAAREASQALDTVDDLLSDRTIASPETRGRQVEEAYQRADTAILGLYTADRAKLQADWQREIDVSTANCNYLERNYALRADQLGAIAAIRTECAGMTAVLSEPGSRGLPFREASASLANSQERVRTIADQLAGSIVGSRTANTTTQRTDVPSPSGTAPPAGRNLAARAGELQAHSGRMLIHIDALQDRLRKQNLLDRQTDDFLVSTRATAQAVNNETSRVVASPDATTNAQRMQHAETRLAQLQQADGQLRTIGRSVNAPPPPVFLGAVAPAAPNGRPTPSQVTSYLDFWEPQLKNRPGGLSTAQSNGIQQMRRDAAFVEKESRDIQALPKGRDRDRLAKELASREARMQQSYANLRATTATMVPNAAPGEFGAYRAGLDQLEAELQAVEKGLPKTQAWQQYLAGARGDIATCRTELQRLEADNFASPAEKQQCKERLEAAGERLGNCQAQLAPTLKRIKEQEAAEARVADEKWHNELQQWEQGSLAAMRSALEHFTALCKMIVDGAKAIARMA